MPYLPPADRAFDVREPVEIFRLIGRRPSQVYVDEAMTPTTAGETKNRLSDGVYWRTQAKVGDQIQARPGTTLLVTATGDVFPILLAEPQPLQPETAFVHAQVAAEADKRVAEALMAAGKLEDALPSRIKTQLPNEPLRVFGAEYPLVVADPPPTSEGSAEPQRRERFGRGRWTGRSR